MKNLFRIWFATIVLVLSMGMTVFAADDDWKTMPTITHAYELSKDKIFLQWEGKADLYRINIDGKEVATVKVKSATVDVKPGVHNIIVIPLHLESKNADTKLELNVGEAGGSIDLATLGVDPKDVRQGTQSEAFKMNYSVDTLLNATPEVKQANTDFHDNVLLTFTDKFDSNIYYISIKSGKDVIPTVFDTSSKDAAALITKNNSTVTITLDQKYLKAHEWMVPDLDQKYSFSVKLAKYPKNYVTNEKETSSVIESKSSKYFEFTPYAAWKTPPEITYASQTANGEITLKWDHDDNGMGCEYVITSPDKVIAVKKGNKEIGKTKKKEYVVTDLENGKHVFTVAAVYGKETGIASDKQTIKVDNSWVVAPAFTCTLKGKKDVVLTWEAPKEIENYHVIVSVGSGSLLKYVNLDFKKYKEFDVPAKQGEMTYTYSYDQNVDSENGTKLQFEIYGSRKTAKGETQKSATSSQTIVLK